MKLEKANNQKKSLKNIQESVLKFLEKIENIKNLPLWLAFSGGVDSSVLLHVIFSLGFKPNLIHINHGFSQNSLIWAQEAERIANLYGLKAEIRSLENNKPALGESLEAFARDQRHQIFSEILTQGGNLLLGHHLDDQAETLLLQLLRGAGPKGLSGMPEQRILGHGQILRPLLSISRLEIETYAKFYELSSVIDESNQNLRFKRNAIRHEVLPILKQHFSGCLLTLSRSARLCADESELLEELITQKFLELKLVTQDQPECFNFKNPEFQNLSQKMQRQLLRVWLRKLLDKALNEKHLSEIQKLLLAEHWPKAKFEVNLGESRVRIFREKVWLRCIKI